MLLGLSASALHAERGDVVFAETFDTEGDFARWEVVDLNGGRAWEYLNGTAAYMLDWQTFLPGDDWLISPAFTLKPNTAYEIRFYMNVLTKVESMRMALADSHDPSVLAQHVLSEYDHVTSLDKGEKVVRICTDANGGAYYLGFYAYSDPDQHRIEVDNVRITDLGPSSIPADVTNLTGEAGASGALSATICFTAPDKAANGETLSDLTAIDIYRGNDLTTPLHSIAHPEAGQELSWTDNNAQQGYNHYSVVARNDDGESQPAVIDIYVGADTPTAIARVSAKVESDLSVTVKWDAPTTSVHGGYVDYSGIRYKVKRNNKTIYTDLADTWFNDPTPGTNEKQGQVKYTITPVAGTMTGESTVSLNVVTGQPLEMPYIETFADRQMVAPWYLDEDACDFEWKRSADSEDDYAISSHDRDNGFLLAESTYGDRGQQSRYVSPILNVSTLEQPVLTFWFYEGRDPWYDPEFQGSVYDKLQVQWRRVGGEWQDLQDATFYQNASTMGWVKCEVLLPRVDDAYINLGLLAIADAEHYAYRDIAIDDISLLEAGYSHDVRMDHLLAEQLRVTVGEEMHLSATLSNRSSHTEHVNVTLLREGTPYAEAEAELAPLARVIVYSQAKVRFALDPDPKKTAIANFRLAYFLDYGSGSVMVSDSPLDLTGGVPASAKKVGTDRIGGKEVPIYEMTVALRPEKLVDVAAREEYIDFEVVGPTVKGGKQYPDPERKSAFRIHALSLVKASVALDETDDPAHPGHIFTIDERGKRIAFTAKPQVAGGSVRTRWTCRDVHGRELFRGTEREIDLDRIDEPGLYSFFIEAEGDDGYVLRHEMRAALVVPSGRVSAKTESPFGTWVWLGGHGTPDKWETLAIPLQKIGVRKCTFRDIPKEIQEKYDLTFTGHVYAPRESTFDPKTGHFKPQGDLDGEAAFVRELQKQVDAAPFANHVLVWHESSPRSGVPPELHGDPAPEVTEKDRARAAYLNEVGRLVHKHFPKLRLQIGNSDNSMGAMSIMYRAGAKPEYFDSLGNEDACQSFCPEMLSTGGPQASKIERDAVRRLTGRTVKIDACYEFGSRRDPTLGERLQAAWFMRDAISCLADGYTLMMLPSMYDGRYGYYDSLWGAGSMARRMPYLQPKQLLVAAAALTKALDGVTFVRELDTGSTTVYAFLFKRMDGRYVTACWCSRGEAEIDLGLSGSAEAMDMYGHSIGLNRGVWPFGKRVVACGECPAYVLSDKPAESAKIVKRTFEHGARLAAKGVRIGTFDSAEKVTLRPEPKLKSESKHSLPVLVPGKFEVETVNDPERGASLKVTLGEKTTNVTEYVTEYTTVRLKEPMEMPGRPCAFGVWVKGNSSWGRIRFEFTDAKGRVFGCYWRAGGWNPFDWPAVYAVNFDGWAFVSGSLDNSPLHWDDTLGLVGNAPSWPWRQISGPDFVTGKVYDYPIRLTAISVSVNRSKFTLIDGFKPSDPSILLNDVVSIELPDKMVK